MPSPPSPNETPGPSSSLTILLTTSEFRGALSYFQLWAGLLNDPRLAGSTWRLKLCAEGDGSCSLTVSHCYQPGWLISDGSYQPKPPLPREDDPDEVWWDRCQADVGILARAYMTIIDWLDKDDLGGWARTGPGIGWHVMLRSHLRDKVLVHGREDVRKAECSAMAAGRAEVWKHGRLKGGP